MLQAKFQGHRTSGSIEEHLKGVFIIYGLGGHTVHVTKTISINYVPSSKGGST